MAVQTKLVNIGTILSLYLRHLSSQLAAGSPDPGLPAEIQMNSSYLVSLLKKQAEAAWVAMASGWCGIPFLAGQLWQRVQFWTCYYVRTRFGCLDHSQRPCHMRPSSLTRVQVPRLGVPIWRGHLQSLRFGFNRQLYNFGVLSFGIALAPRSHGCHGSGISTHSPSHVPHVEMLPESIPSFWGLFTSESASQHSFVTLHGWLGPVVCCKLIFTLQDTSSVGWGPN